MAATETQVTEAEAYVTGWVACRNGEDGRYTNPHRRRSAAAFAWDAGFLDSMESADDEKPEPECAGFGPPKKKD